MLFLQISFLPLSSSGTPIMWMLVCLMLSHTFLMLSSLFCFFFLLLWLDEFHCPVFVFIDFSLLLYLIFFQPLYCIFQFSYCVFQLWDFYLVSSYILSPWNSHFVYPFFSWVWWALLWLLFWTLYQVNYLSPFHWGLFLMFYILFFNLEHIPLFIHFALLSLSVYMS